MLRALIVFCMLALGPTGLRASYVIQDGVPGIVSRQDNGRMLDSYGLVWTAPGEPGGEWHQDLNYVSPPFPVSMIRFWDYSEIITMDNHNWRLSAGQWVDYGAWPGVVGVDPSLIREEATLAVSILSTPGPGPFQVSFSMPGAGPVSVTVYDAAGRQVRELLTAELPAGEYAPAWEGRDGAGREAPSGVYLARILTPAGVESARIVLTR